MGMYSETVQYVQCVTVYGVTVYSTYCGVTPAVYLDPAYIFRQAEFRKQQGSHSFEGVRSHLY